MITIYGCPGTRSFRAVWAMEEAGVSYEYVKIDLAAGEGRQPSFCRINPGGKVPVLVDGEFVLTESAAICTYIGDRFPDSRLTPRAGTRERAQYDRWCYFVIGELEQPLWTTAKHRFALPADWRVPAVVETAVKEFAVALGVLEEGLGAKPFILGEAFTAADILIIQTLLWAKKRDVLPESERLLAYVNRAVCRPAYARALVREAD
jgi:glutathione S-transferase